MSSIKFCVQLTHYNQKITINRFTLSSTQVKQILADHSRTEYEKMQTETAEQIFEVIKEEVQKMVCGNVWYTKWEDIPQQPDWKQFTINCIRTWQTENKQPLYALFIGPRWSHYGATLLQFSRNREELDGIASTINTQSESWGYAYVDLFDDKMAEYSFPSRDPK